ncbi:MAG: BrnT family toxin [Acidobacteriota bacterium]
MKITECLWLDEFVDKIIRKHNVYPEEIEELFSRDPLIRRLENGRVKGEDLFMAFGTTNAGRYLTALFVRKRGKRALVISAREMTKGERKKYGKR